FGEKARAVLLARQEADRKAKESARGSPVPGKAPLDWLELPDLIVGMDPWFAGILRPAVLLGLKDRDPQFRALAAKAVPPLLKGAVVVPATGRIPEGVIRARQELINALKAASKDP